MIGFRTAAALLAASVVVVCGVAGLGAGDAQADLGDRFSFAPVQANGTDAPALAPAERAFWAGVCDIHGGDFASAGGVGSDPGTRYTHCIDHPASFPRDPGQEFTPSDLLHPPLAPGLEPDGLDDGWIRSATGATGGPAWRLADAAQAGGHPDGSTTFWFSRGTEFSAGNIADGPDGSVRDVRVSLPPGVLADPNAVPKCSSENLRDVPTSCPPQSQVGVSTISLANFTAVFPVYNAAPRDGRVAELVISGPGIDGAFQTNIPITADVRTDGDFGADGSATTIPAAVSAHSQTITLWGVPWAASHDAYRPVPAYCHIPADINGDPLGTSGWLTGGALSPFGLAGGTNDGCDQDPVSYHPSWGPVKSFFTTQTDCSPQNPVTRIRATNYQTPVVAEAESVAPLITGCEDIQFATRASFSMSQTGTRADGPSGLEVDLDVEQNTVAPLAKRFNADDDDPESAVAHWKSTEGLATSHLDQTVVDLPAGLSINPSGATGLGGCTDAQIGLRQPGNPPLFNDLDPFDGSHAGGVECPQSSVIGSAEVETHLLDERLTGQLVLGQPKPQDIGAADEPLLTRLFLVLRNRQRGLVAKIAGTTVADPVTGRLRANFDENPRVPFDRLRLSVKGGERGMLALPQRCTTTSWSSEMRPWSGGDAAVDSAAFVTDQNCANAFAPTLAAGMDTPAARSSGKFSFKFARPEGNQYFRGLRAVLPTGLLASVRDVPLCTNAQANAGTCPLGSQIGIVDAKAGSGDPFVLEQKGRVYLTEGYKGGEYGLAVKIRPIAGPFRGAAELSPIIVRQAIHVDRTTAQVTAISDPFPLIHHGIPLRVREVTVKVDRDGFMLNPSDCSAKQVAAAISSDQGATAHRSNRFQATRCARLPFEPRLGLRLVGRRQVTTGRHPAIRARVRQAGVGEAGIQRAEVRLPKSLALDVNNAQALCEFEDGTRVDPENHCPDGSIVGRARAISPLLNDPLVGDVFFVKNIRIDPDTGNEIRTLPMLIVALRGEVNINLKGESDVKRGHLVNTFADVPDAPISRFAMNIRGGRNGILAVTRSRRSRFNLCRMGRQVAEADMDGQNGRRHDFNVVMRKPCGKRRTSAGRICRKRTNNKKALRRCMRNVKRTRAKRAARAKRVARHRAVRR